MKRTLIITALATVPFAAQATDLDYDTWLQHYWRHRAPHVVPHVLPHMHSNPHPDALAYPTYQYEREYGRPLYSAPELRDYLDSYEADW